MDVGAECLRWMLEMSVGDRDGCWRWMLEMGFGDGYQR